MFVRKTRAFYVDEIDGSGQFHQHFSLVEVRLYNKEYQRKSCS